MIREVRRREATVAAREIAGALNARHCDCAGLAVARDDREQCTGTDLVSVYESPSCCLILFRRHGEDQPFADAAVKNFRAAGMWDFDGTCLHVIHANNTAVTYPQQLLPPQLLPQLFPNFRKGQGST